MADRAAGRGDIFPGSGEMSQRMREFDWSSTPLGEPESWPDALKIPLRMLLTSRFEMWLGWGDELSFFYNDAYIPTLGVKHPSMLGQPFREVWAEVYEDVVDQVARVRAGEATWNEALLLLLERSGYPEETYHSFSYSPLHGEGGDVDGLLCIVTEVTERVINDRRLRTLRALGSELVGASTREGVCQGVASILAVNRHDFPFALLYIGEDRDQAAVACSVDALALLSCTWPFGIARAQPAVVGLESAGKPPSGPWALAPREALIVAVLGADGESPVGHLVLGLNPYRRRDETLAEFARMLAGQISGALSNVATLEAERQRADRIWAHSRDLLVTVGSDGIFRSVSPAWTNILGHPTYQVVGRHIGEFIMPEDRKSTADALRRAAGGTNLTSFENRYRTVDGRFRWISWHTSGEGDVVYGYGRDITEQKLNAEALASAEEALRQSQKMEVIGQLTGGVAHDFNNLLMAIIANLDLLKRHASDPRTLRLIDSAMQGANRGASLTQRLLAFARKQELDLSPADLNELVMGVGDLLTKSVGPNIELRHDLQPDLPPALVDANQIELALLNLVVNARDALSQGGLIAIATDSVALRNDDQLPDGSYVRLSVTDNGTGMDEETLARATDPFFSTKELGKGTGLGLSMIHGLAIQLHGSLRLRSRMGQGTTAELLFPATGDEPAVRISDRVREANSGAEALKLIEEGERFDLVVTDFSMPKMNGGEFAVAARKLQPDLPILLATGYADLPAGSDLALPRLSKPYDQRLLQREISKLMG